MQRKHFFIYLSVMMFMTGIVIFTLFNDRFYHDPIGQVTHVQEISSKKVMDENHNMDRMHTERLTIVMTNGSHKGEMIHLDNDYAESLAYSTHYHPGDKVFLSLSKPVSINGEKRDTMLSIIGLLFVGLLLVVGRMKGLFSIISLFVNIFVSLSILMLNVHYPKIPLIIIALAAVLLSTVITMLLVSGWNKKSLIAVISTIISVLVTLMIVQFVIWITDGKGIRYETIVFLTMPPKKIFLTSILIGSLGAIMDITITIASALYELKENNPAIPRTALIQSGRKIGHDIIGPMTNVLFFAYLSGAVPMIILYLRNYSPIFHSFSIHWSIELARAVTSSIGIVLTIPITVYIATALLSKEEVR